jgi:hypothetical protein
MSRERVYVPSSLRRLRQVVVAGELGPAPFAAHAVTDALRAAYGDGDEEEWEYAAAAAAAQAAVALLTPGEPARRVVLAVDAARVRPADTGDTGDPTVVTVEAVVPLRRVAAVMTDAADAEPDVAAARDALAAGREDSEALLDRCLDHELGWWATQEISALLEKLGPVPPV